jgi:3-hydroxyisobutyrate dehydrogenase-like beta-hydroxyacid dehydrogenase
MNAFGRRVFVIGTRPSQANLLKLCANFLIYSTVEQLGEVFALVEKGGINRAVAFQMLTESFFNAPVHKNYGQLILERNFDPPGANVVLGAKDIRLVLQAGQDLSVPLPFASTVRDRFLASIARGESDLDFTAIARRAAEDGGLKT